MGTTSAMGKTRLRVLFGMPGVRVDLQIESTDKLENLLKGFYDSDVLYSNLA